jgi:hypothetical protein
MMKINQWLISISLLWGCLACQPNKVEPIEAVKDSDTSQTDTTLEDRQADGYIHDELMPVKYGNVLLVLGGSPSLSYDLQPANLYCYRLEKFLTKEYNIINAAIANETNDQFIRRLPSLLEHDVNAIIIEIGADEAQRQLNRTSFNKKIAFLLKEVQHKKGERPIFIIPSSNNSSYMKVIEQHIVSSPNIHIINPADFSPLSAEWHEFIARQIAKQLDIL